MKTVTQIVLAILACTVGFSAFGQALHDVNDLMLWKSENDSRAEIPTAIARLFNSLYNTGQLPLRLVELQKGQTVEEALRNAQAFAGPFFPISVDSLLCDLNSDLCNRELVETAPQAFVDPASHVGGFQFSKGRWAVEPGDIIVIPDIQFTEYEEFSISWKNSGTSIQEILEERGVRCDRYSKSCYDAVRLLNRSNPQALKESYEGEVVLPTRGVSTRIRLVHPDDAIGELRNPVREEVGGRVDVPLRDSVLGESADFASVAVTADSASDPEADSAPESEAMETEANTPALERRPQPIFRQSVDYEQFIKDSSHMEDLAYKGIESNVGTRGEAGIQAHITGEPRFAEQKNLFDLIRHPALDANWHPAMDWSSTITVLDSWVDSSHCDIGSNVEVVNESPVPAPMTAVGTCGDLEPANPVEHHGTHVTALISGSVNHQGIGGLLPSEARVNTHEVIEDRLRSDVYRDQVGHWITDIAIDKDSRTYNLSWFYKNDLGGIDRIARTIDVIRGQALFVAPAGNGATNHNSDGCSLNPACLYTFPNVITVVGLNRDDAHPQLWHVGDHEGSSFASFFHVGGIAENVLSATRANRHGRLSGTSQAAPQVSATAAYLWAILAASSTDEISPQEVKNRIIYTADFFPHLQDKLMGGRLNMKRALDVDTTYIRRTDDSETRGSFVAYRGLDGSPASLVIVKEGGNETRIDFRQIKRLLRLPGSPRYVIFYVEDDGELVRKVGVDLLTRSQQVHILGDGAIEATKTSLVNIDEYVAAF